MDGFHAQEQYVVIAAPRDQVRAQMLAMPPAEEIREDGQGGVQFETQLMEGVSLAAQVNLEATPLGTRVELLQSVMCEQELSSANVNSIIEYIESAGDDWITAVAAHLEGRAMELKVADRHIDLHCRIQADHRDVATAIANALDGDINWQEGMVTAEEDAEDITEAFEDARPTVSQAWLTPLGSEGTDVVLHIDGSIAVVVGMPTATEDAITRARAALVDFLTTLGPVEIYPSTPDCAALVGPDRIRAAIAPSATDAITQIPLATSLRGLPARRRAIAPATWNRTPGAERTL